MTAPDHAVAVRLCLQQLTDPNVQCLKDPAELAAIGFKAVHAQGMTGVQRVDERVLAAMEAYADVAPAHNPPYVTAMRLLASELPEIPLVAAFETGFHETIPPAQRLYAVPLEWAEKHGIQRWGFHGASHRYIAERTAQLARASPRRKIISCHLGGSSSLCAIRAGKSVATSLGMSPQSGLPHNNRVGDFDVFALPALMRATGKTLEQVLDDLANRSGLLGLSGHNDLRDIEAAAAKGDAASAAGPGRVRRLGAALPRVLTAAAGRRRRDRLHRRHRRELGADARGRLRQPGLVRHRSSTRRERKPPRARCAIDAAEQPRADVDHADQRGIDRGPAGEGVAGKR